MDVHGHPAASIGVRDHSRLQSKSGTGLDQAQKAMEVPGAMTDAGALQESGKCSTRMYIDASFPADLAMLRCVWEPLFLSAKDARAKHAFAPHTGLQAVHALFASIYFKQRVPAPSTYALKRLANSLTRKGVGKMYVEQRGQGPAPACAGSSQTTEQADEMAAGICSSKLLAAPATPAPLPAVPLTCGNSGLTPARINKLVRGNAADDDDADADADSDAAAAAAAAHAAAAAAHATPAHPPPAGRHAATYELECIQKIDAAAAHHG
eukprot:4103250-Pleurochrysis_carterae.AAC.2